MPRQKKKKPSQDPGSSAVAEPVQSHSENQPEASSGDGGGKGKGRKGKGKGGDQQHQSYQKPAGPPKKQQTIQELPGPSKKQQTIQELPGPSKKQQTIQELPGPSKKQQTIQELPGPPQKPHQQAIAQKDPFPQLQVTESQPQISGDGAGKGKGKKGKGRGAGDQPLQTLEEPSTFQKKQLQQSQQQQKLQQQPLQRGEPEPLGVPAPSVPVPSVWGRGKIPPPGFGRGTTRPGVAPPGPSLPSTQGPPPGFREQARPSPPSSEIGSGEPIRTVRDATLLRDIEAATSKLATLKIPVRADINKGGSRGKRIYVETNHLTLDLSRLRSKIAIHYDVAIEPDKPKRLLRFAMEQFREKHYSNRYPAFDGRKNLVSADYLPFKDSISDTVSVRDEESTRDKEFKITIKYASRVDLTTLCNYMKAGTSLDTPQTAIQMIDIVLRNAPAMRFVPVGRSYFTPPSGQILQLGDGMEMWYGLYQSVNLGWRPFVNVDVAHKAFPTSQNVIDLIKELCGDFRTGQIDLSRELSDYQQEDFRKYIKKLKVDYEIPGQPQTKRTYRVNDIAHSAARLTFSLENEKLTVAEYFRYNKKYTLKFPNMPCLHVGSLNRPNPIYLPAECCKVTKGQAVNRMMNDKQTSNMIRAAATSTSVRKAKILDALQRVNFNAHPAVKEFGLQVSDKFACVPARILPPPELAFKEGLKIPERGVWRALKFLKGQPLLKWAILNLDDRTRDSAIRDTVTALQSAGSGLGMQIDQPHPVLFMDPPIRKPRNPQFYHRAKESVISFFKQNNDKQLILVIVPDKGEAYASVKQLAELNVGVLTQCLKGKTVSRMNFSTASNILLKVNSKLNGVNHQLSRTVRPKCLEVPAMLIGADVTHPSPQQTNIPSVAAVCASHDPNGFCYNIQFRLQPAREEIIQDLQNLMRNHLLFFKERTGHQPLKLLFFRDGVSEGQFSQVLQAELQAIRRACLSLHPEYKPAITFLVVQKRHHTRFFPTTQADSDGRNCNVPAGTIVDTEITHPTEIDFYLVSHASIQGVSRPTKYHCLWDDSKMSDDELQQLTYFLCHMFSRCTRSVSYPAPTYYAHLAAYRARVYIEGREIQLNNLEHEQALSTIKKQLCDNSPMFFV